MRLNALNVMASFVNTAAGITVIVRYVWWYTAIEFSLGQICL